VRKNKGKEANEKKMHFEQEGAGGAKGGEGGAKASGMAGQKNQGKKKKGHVAGNRGG